MTHRGPFQPLLFCDSVINPVLNVEIQSCSEIAEYVFLSNSMHRVALNLHKLTIVICGTPDIATSAFFSKIMKRKK